MKRAAAWSVHLLTASGAVWGLLALREIARGQVPSALGWMALAVLVDGLDGPIARRLDVDRQLPSIDGALLDNLVDYLNYVVVPAWLIHESGLVAPAWRLAVASAICVASAFQFAHRGAKEDGQWFRGFPSYWNVAAFYLLVLHPPPWLAAAILAALCLLVFVPVRYVYPSRTPRYRGLTLTLTVLWGLALGVLLLEYPMPRPWLVYGSLLYPVYYFGLSLSLGGTTASRPRAAEPC